MTKNNEQIIIDGEKLTKAEFINKFSFKFTNATICERERICSILFDIAYRKKQECEKAKQNAQDTYDLWQALIESFNILQGEKIKLEQECEAYKMEAEEGREINAELKAENEELTSKCSQLRDELNFHIHNMNEQNEALHNKNKQLKAQILDQEAETLKAGGIIHKLEQTLTEIKEITERGLNCPQCSCGAKADLDLILQKINEVIDDKSND